MYLPHELRQDFHYLSLRSSLLEEISLLYGRPLAAGDRIGRICRCRRLVRDFLAAWQCQPDQPEYPYLLGVLLERAGQLALTDQPGRAYDQAEQYYDGPGSSYSGSRLALIADSSTCARCWPCCACPCAGGRKNGFMPGGTIAAACAASTATYRPCSRCVGSSSRKIMTGRLSSSGICTAWPAGRVLFRRPGPASCRISLQRPCTGLELL